MKKSVLVISVMMFLIISILSTNVYACVGARPLAMGGAFISVADDVNAIYWNPAGLTQLDEFEVTYTRTINNRDLFNYNDFIGSAGRIDELGVSYGLGYIGEGIEFSQYDFDLEDTIEIEQSTNWFILSLARDFSNSLSLGANIRLMNMNYEVSSGFESVSDDDTNIAIDFSALYQFNEQLYAGILFQDFFETEFELFGEEIYFIRNIRPGVSFQPDDYLTLAFSIYDLNDEFDRNISFGGELELIEITNLEILNSNKENVFLRGGFYQENLTFGTGYKYEDFKFDYAFLGGDLGDTHQLGVTYQFGSF